MDKINVEAILSKRIVQFPSDETNGMTSEAIRRNVKAAIKEIVEAVIDKCAEEAVAKGEGTGGLNTKNKNLYWTYGGNIGNVIIDKESILNIKKEIEYE